MIIIYFLLTIILVLLLWIIFVPVYLKLDTDGNKYEIRQIGTMKFSFHPGEKQIFRMRVFGLNIPLQRKTIEKKEQRIKKNKRSKKRSFHAWIFLLNGIKNSFQLNNLSCSIDTNDVILNVQLIPIMHYFNGKQVHLSTNFMKRNYFYMEIEGHINKIIWVIIRFLFKH